MKTLSNIAVYFGIVSVILTLLTFLLKRFMEKVLIRAVALHSATLLLDGKPIDSEDLKEIYKKETRGDLLNYEAIEIVDEMQRVLERDNRIHMLEDKNTFKKIKDSIPRNKQFDQEYGCLLILSVPLVFGFVGLKSNPTTWDKLLISSALVLLPSVLFLIGDINTWASFLSVLRKKARYNREYLFHTGRGRN